MMARPFDWIRPRGKRLTIVLAAGVDAVTTDKPIAAAAFTARSARRPLYRPPCGSRSFVKPNNATTGLALAGIERRGLVAIRHLLES
jgi:hypothetical protein